MKTNYRICTALELKPSISLNSSSTTPSSQYSSSNSSSTTPSSQHSFFGDSNKATKLSEDEDSLSLAYSSLNESPSSLEGESILEEGYCFIKSEPSPSIFSPSYLTRDTYGSNLNDPLYLSLKNKINLYRMLGITKEIKNIIEKIITNPKNYSQDNKIKDSIFLSELCENHLFKEIDSKPLDLTQYEEFDWIKFSDQIIYYSLFRTQAMDYFIPSQLKNLIDRKITKKTSSIKNILIDLDLANTKNNYQPVEYIAKELNKFLDYFHNLYHNKKLPLDIITDINERLKKIHNNFFYFITKKYLKYKELIDKDSFINKNYDFCFNQMVIQITRLNEKYFIRFEKYKDRILTYENSLTKSLFKLNKIGSELFILESILEELTKI